MTSRIIITVVCLSAALVACEDPYRDNIIEELGEEQSGFAPSDVHRPGQPCLACHSDYRGDEPLMAFGGTIFAETVGVVENSDLILLEGYEIKLIDSEGQERIVRSNRCGNFFLTKEQFNPAYPVRAELWGHTSPDAAAGDPTVLLRPMSTRIGRDGSCGSCHINPASPFSAGVVFVPGAFLAAPEPPVGCPTPKFVDPL